MINLYIITSERDGSYEVIEELAEKVRHFDNGDHFFFRLSSPGKWKNIVVPKERLIYFVISRDDSDGEDDYYEEGVEE